MLAPDNEVPIFEGSPVKRTESYMETYKTVSQDIRDQLNAEAEAVQIILTGIDNDIYSTVDACSNACEMWKAIKRLKQGESINVQDLETNLYWEFRKFTSHDDDETSKEKEIDKLMALITLSFKKIYKLTNNNLRTLSNTSQANQDNYLRITEALDAVDSGSIFDIGPVQKVSTDDNYNVFAIDHEHPEQSESNHDTYSIEQDEHNVIIDSLDMSYDREQIDQNDDDADLKSQAELARRNDVEYASKKEAQIKLYKTHEDNELDKVVALKNKVKVLDNIVYKTGQSVQTMNILNNKCRTSFTKPEFLKKAQIANSRLYDIGVIPTTSVSKPQLKSNPIEDRVMRNNSQGKKQDVEDHRRSVGFSKNKTFVTACNNSLNAKTLNVNFVSATCDKCVLNDKHDMCVLNSIAKPLKKIVIEIVLFIVDSGCSKHMTRNLKLLINFVEKFLGTVKFGNDQIAPILGYGDLHRRLSHLNFDTINLLSKNDIVVGLPKLKFVKDHLCSSFELGKAKRKSFYTKLTPSSMRRLQLLHMDLCGPMRVASINGKRYVLVIVDDYSRYTWTHFLRSKDETPEVLIDFLRLVQSGLQAQVRIVRTDKGTKFLNQTLHAYFAVEGILHQTSVARTPEQNGVVKRRNRTLVEATRTMLSVAKVPLFFWAEAIATTCFTQNRSLVIPRHEKNLTTSSTTRNHLVSSDPSLECHRMALEHESLSPSPQCQENVTQADKTVTTSNELDLLLSLMFDELLNGSSQVVSKSSANMNQAKMVEEYAQVENDEFINIFCMQTKDHPLEQVIGNPSQYVRTRRQLESDGEMCMFALTVSQTEPKNIKEAMVDSAWIKSMQEELH
nr:retrovirus-related Pol polyprotein from transposon TNT 1-94 [Tanacetum cinerariifolium]